MPCFIKDSHLVLSVVVVIALISILISPNNVEASTRPPSVSMCQHQTSCISCLGTRSSDLMANNGSCIWELTSFGPRCVDQFVASESIIKLVYTQSGCENADPSVGKGVPCHDNQTCQVRDVHTFCGRSTSPSADDLNCQCEHGYVNTKDSNSSHIRCLEANLLLGSFCEESQQCSSHTNNSSNSSVCNPGSNICDCESSSFIPSDDLKRCLPIVYDLVSTKCEEDAQCQFGEPGSLSVCAAQEMGPSSNGSAKVCKCSPGIAVNRISDNKCLPITRNIGIMTCEIHAQCTAGLGHSRCVGVKCECNKGYKSYLLDGDRWICARE